MNEKRRKALESGYGTEPEPKQGLLDLGGVLDAECAPAFKKAIPYTCIVEIIGDVKANGVAAVKNPLTLAKVAWAMGCLSTLLGDMVKVGLLTMDDISNAFADDPKMAQTANGEGGAPALDQVQVAMLQGNMDELRDTMEDTPKNVGVGQFGIGTALTVLSALSTLYKLWKSLSGSGGGDNSRHITKIRLASGQPE